MAEIRNWNFHRLDIDFNPLAKPNGKDKPSDMDMVYISKDNTLIIGEFKNETKPYIEDGQKWLIERYINGWKYDALALLIIHNKYVQRNDTKVNAAECYVKEIFYKRVGRWVEPKKPTTVKDIINYYRGGNT